MKLLILEGNAPKDSMAAMAGVFSGRIWLGNLNDIWCYLIMPLNYLRWAALVIPTKMGESFGKRPWTFLSHFVQRVGLKTEQTFHKYSLTWWHYDCERLGPSPGHWPEFLSHGVWSSISSMLGRACAAMWELESHEKNRRESSVFYWQRAPKGCRSESLLIRKQRHMNGQIL